MTGRIVCPGCGMSTWRNGGCALEGCENYGEECTTCPCTEDGHCLCPCRGCQFHCNACWCEPCQLQQEGVLA